METTTNKKEEPLLSSSQQQQQAQEATSPVSASSSFINGVEPVSPLSQQQTEDEWPNIYDECYEMMLAAIMLYGVVDLRTLARNNKKNHNLCSLDDGTGDNTTTTTQQQQQHDLENDDNDNSQQLLQLPISSTEIVILLGKNKITIQNEIGKEFTDLYLDAFEQIMEDDTPQDGSLEVMQLSSGSGSSCNKIQLLSFDFVVVGDINSTSELVYGICVHHSRKRITVIFRGCQTRTDWTVCSEIFLKDIPNPVITHTSTTLNNDDGDINNSSSHRRYHHQQSSDSDHHRSNENNNNNTKNPETIAIHRGFYRYLFSDSSSTSTSTSPTSSSYTSHQRREEEDDNNDQKATTTSTTTTTTTTTKFHEICNEIQQIQTQYPEYKVYITGHSLGGALATVFAFHYAASLKTPTPSPTPTTTTTISTTSPSSPSSPITITCIPIASPMVGNLSFENAFKTLEKQKRLRCLRITNHHDIFTQLPDRSLSLYIFAAYFWSFFYYVGGTWLFFIFFQNTVYRHVGMDLHLYYGGYTYKIKRTKGSSDWFVCRVIEDWKRHFKQTIQRIMTLPFVCFCDYCYCKTNFNTNHSVQEHILRLKSLKPILSSIYLSDLYEEKRFTTTTSSSLLSSHHGGDSTKAGATTDCYSYYDYDNYCNNCTIYHHDNNNGNNNNNNNNVDDASSSSSRRNHHHHRQSNNNNNDKNHHYQNYNNLAREVTTTKATTKMIRLKHLEIMMAEEEEGISNSSNSNTRRTTNEDGILIENV